MAGTAVAASLVATGVTAQAAPPKLGFGPCPEDISKPYPDMQCANLDVPLDYAKPDGEKVRLLVSKLPAKDPAKRRGILVTNPGGPGGPGVDFAGTLSTKLPREVLDSYDLIGFDTRNSAHSTPITCVDPATYWKNPLPDPDAESTRRLNWQRAEEYAKGCQQRAGKYLPHLTTPNNARDMDQIRAALGEQKASYLGYSYGTYLGAVYGQLFPDRVDRMILDSAVNPDPQKIWYQNNLGQDIPAQVRLGQFFDWVARYDQVFHLGTKREDVQKAWDGIRDELRQKPHGPLGPFELDLISFNAMYGEKSWTPLAQAISDFRNAKDDKKFVEMVGVVDDAAENENAIYNAVECADATWPTDEKTWEQDSKRLEGKAPMAAWFNSWGVAPCSKWKAPSRQPMKITGEKLPGVLMFNSTFDAATPYEGAQVMHQSLPSSRLITEDQAGKHGVYALAGNPDANRIGTDYLVQGTLPPQDGSIPAHPLPDPTKPASVSEASKQVDLGR
jgi:pimeloyl-ACP methyl ester carboxylesterase